MSMTTWKSSCLRSWSSSLLQEVAFNYNVFILHNLNKLAIMWQNIFSIHIGMYVLMSSSGALG